MCCLLDLLAGDALVLCPLKLVVHLVEVFCKSAGDLVLNGLLSRVPDLVEAKSFKFFPYSTLKKIQSSLRNLQEGNFVSMSSAINLFVPNIVDDIRPMGDLILASSSAVVTLKVEFTGNKGASGKQIVMT